MPEKAPVKPEAKKTEEKKPTNSFAQFQAKGNPNQFHKSVSKKGGGMPPAVRPRAAAKGR